jgi:septal ring factor EnvC (AmiA/AmiB activator)
MRLFLLKKIKTTSLIVCVIFFGIIYHPLFAQTKSQLSQKELLNKKNKLNEDIKQLNSQLSQTKASKKSKINTIIIINTKIKIREELINTINNELSKVNADIKKNATEITALRKDLEKLKHEYAKMIYFAQRNQDSYNKIMFLFSSGNFNQAYMRIKYFQQYTAFRKKQANEIISSQTVLKRKLKELELIQQEKNELLANEKQEKIQLSSEKQEQEVVLTGLQQQEQELKKELEKKKRDNENLQIAIKKLIEAEIRRKAEESAKSKDIAKTEKTKTTKTKDKTESGDAKLPTIQLTPEAEALGSDFSNNRGKLPWPVTKGVICQPYGEYEHPAIKGFMMNNNGVEICTSKDSQVRAIFGGEVTCIALSPTGGKLIIIRHGEYSSVYVNINEVFVKQGDKVTIKQNIGTLTDDDGKTSLNFQIWKNQKTMNPSGWLYGGG